MSNVLTKEKVVSLSMCDGSAKLSIPNAFEQLMDVASEHAELLGMGIKPMAKRNMFWLAIKTRLRFSRRPSLGEKITITTWPSPAFGKRCLRFYSIKCGDEVVAEGKNEWAVLDATNMQQIDVAQVYSGEICFSDAVVCPEKFSRIDEDFSEGRLLGTHVVRSTDIDFAGHMNNAAYVRAIFGLFSTDQLKALRIRDVEIVYRAPCFESDELTVKVRQSNSGLELGMIQKSGKIAVLAKLS